MGAEVIIIDVVQQAIQSLQTHADAQRDQQLYERYHRAMTNLDTEITNLTRKLDMVDVIRQQGWVTEFNIGSEIISCLLGALYTLRDNCVLVGTLTHDNVKVLEQAIARLNTDTTQQWMRLAREHAGSLSASLTLIAGISENPSAARECRDAVESACKGMPSSREEVIRFADSVARGQGILEKLSVDAQTRAFLGKLTSGRATLLDIDDHIRNWIKAQNLAEKLSVGFISNR